MDRDVSKGVDPVIQSYPIAPRPDQLSMPRRRWTRLCVAAGMATLLIVTGIAGCSDPQAGDSAAGGMSISASAAISPTTESNAGSSMSGVAPSSPVADQSLIPPPAAASLPMESAAAAPAPTSPAGDSTPEQATTALEALAALPIRERATTAGYSRDQFGQAWSDDVNVDGGHNGCDTRNDILRRDLTALQIKTGTQGCVVLSGTLDDPYSAHDIPFVRGAATSNAVQIDHLVALSDAWQSGAQQLTADQRQNLANDPLNLQAVSGPVNEAKGDGDAAQWLPPNVAYRCVYVTRQIQVKARYELWVVPAEHEAMSRILTGCSALPVPNSAAPLDATPQSALTTPAPQAPETVVTMPPPESDSSVYFKNCAEARAAGVAPLYRGQPGYRDPMDGDHDGVACET